MRPEEGSLQNFIRIFIYRMSLYPMRPRYYALVKGGLCIFHVLKGQVFLVLGQTTTKPLIITEFDRALRAAKLAACIRTRHVGHPSPAGRSSHMEHCPCL
jgi:hypothetical protein